MNPTSGLWDIKSQKGTDQGSATPGSTAWDCGSAQRRTEFTAQEKGVAETILHSAEIKAALEAILVLGSFWGVSPNCRHDGRVVCTAQSCSLPLYQGPDSFLAISCPSAPSRLAWIDTHVVLPTATYLWCNTNFTPGNFPGYLCNPATRENPRKYASLAPELLLQVEYFSCCSVKSDRSVHSSVMQHNCKLRIKICNTPSLIISN